MAFPGDYNWKVDITTDSTKVDSSETDFPYYFDLSDITSSDFWNNVQSDGGDLRVSSDSAGSTQLPLEVVSIDTVGETGEIHFKDDTDSASDVTYYLWWDDSTGTVSQPGTGTSFGRDNVWTSYTAVWHLEDASTDSTGNGFSLTDSGTSSVAGQVGDARDFDGASDYIDVDDTTSCFGTGDTTVTVWQNADSVVSDGGAFTRWINKGGGSSRAYELGVFTDNRVILQYENSSNNFNTFLSTDTLSTNTWYHVAMVVDPGNTGWIYINGSETSGYDARPTPGSFKNNTDDVLIGEWRSRDGSFNGTIDEMRVAAALLSSGWIATEYNMQNSPSTFWTVGTPESASAAETFNAPFFGGGV